MKKLVLGVMGIALLAVACQKNVDVQKPLVPGGAALDTLVGTITTNTTVTKNAYLYGLVYVAPGVTLTINPGVTIYGSPYTGTSGVFDPVNAEKNKGTLVVQRGAKLNAAGTLGNPIIWTSDNKIAVGSRKYGDWGGVIIMGAATFHDAAGNVNTTTRFEAFDIVPSDLRNFYGGNNDADNSGVLTYNRIEFAGGVVTEVNKEVNGLTLCAVGNGTTIHHIEVLKAGDDGVEFFGGSVNINHFLVYAAKDDDFDFDQGYHGNLQFIIGYRDTTADNSGSHSIEADNDAAASNIAPYTSPFIANATLIGPGTAKNFTAGSQSYFDGAVLIRRRVSVKLVNSYVIAQANPYALVFTPTTGSGTGVAPVAALLDPPALTLPGNVEAFNIYQINNPAFGGVAVQSSIEGNPVALGLSNDAGDVTKLTAAANANNALTSFADFKLGGTLENTAATPFLNTGTNLASLGLPFVGTTQRGGVITSDNWTAAGVSVGTPWISIATN